MKECRSCHRSLSLAEFYKHSEMSDGHLNHCKQCVKERVRTHRQTHDSVREYDRLRYRQDPKVLRRLESYQRRNSDFYKIVKRVSALVYNAVRDGLITKSSCCDNCGQEKTLEAAHHDYNKPLDVRWLCRRCHRQWDAAQPKGKSLRAA